MSEHHGSVHWRRTSADFTYDSYNRAHAVTFKEGAVVLPGSANPMFRGDADRVDPEEAYVASLAACHMLTFLAICARKRLTVDSYEDDALGIMEKGENGKLWVSRVTLRPKITFAPGTSITPAQIEQIHHQSHGECFIANSVKTDVTVAPHS
ncbi:MAG: OsmC family protein [Alphaproteobacteria bacterium]|nr:OsmC family protein [Alphaproteobacteria bacterium]MBV9418864.1 OsmC family protein [Alphaproteobacteria bacterium]MBV9540116.1 OsmC family protein [Alphaproteobacteria bacterium]MBV9905077.1 OsmC family protein [Alphaproteobacteria bacterium]